jgi:hypothetical protein
VRASDLKRAVEAMGFTWENSTRGSHIKISGPNLQRPVPVTLHNGLREEISDILLKKIAKQLGILPESLKG